MAFATFSLGCSDDAERGEAWRLAGNAGGVRECETAADCPEGWYCDDSVACGAPSYCVEGESPCSAAPPILTCSCDAVIDYAAAGCPGPYAWNAGALGWDVQGQPCDSEARSPFSYRVTARIQDDLPTEGEVFARLIGGFEPEPDVVAVPDRRTIEVVATGDEWVNFNFEILVDRNGDGVCDPVQDESLLASVLSQNVDFTTFDVALELELRPTDPCDRW